MTKKNQNAFYTRRGDLTDEYARLCVCNFSGNLTVIARRINIYNALAVKGTFGAVTGGEILEHVRECAPEQEARIDAGIKWLVSHGVFTQTPFDVAGESNIPGVFSRAAQIKAAQILDGMEQTE